jgi:hypothetical protein
MNGVLRQSARPATILPIVVSPDATTIACPGRSIAVVVVNVKTGDAAPSWYRGRAGPDQAPTRMRREVDCERAALLRPLTDEGVLAEWVSSGDARARARPRKSGDSFGLASLPGYRARNAFDLGPHGRSASGPRPSGSAAEGTR